MRRRPQPFPLAARLSHAEEFPDELGRINYATIRLRSLIPSAAFILHPFLRAPISPRLTNRQGQRSRSRPYSGLDFQELDLSRFSPAQSGNAGEFLSLDYSLRFPLL